MNRNPVNTVVVLLIGFGTYLAVQPWLLEADGALDRKLATVARIEVDYSPSDPFRLPGRITMRYK